MEEESNVPANEPEAQVSFQFETLEEVKTARDDGKISEEECRKISRNLMLKNVGRIMEARKDQPVFSGARSSRPQGSTFSVTDRPPIIWMDWDTMMSKANEAIDWSVENMWTTRGRVLVAAEQKAGKTFVVCSMAVSVASGKKFLGAFEIKRPGPVLIVAGEDDAAEMARRMHRMCRALGIEEKLPIHFGDAHGAALNRPAEIQMIKDMAKQVGAVLVIADPLARLMEGDENSKECIASVLNPAGLLADDMDMAYCFVHHLGKQSGDNPRSNANRVRGSSDIASWFTTGIFLSGQMSDGQVVAEVIQRTSGNIPPKFAIDVVEDRDQSAHGKGTMKLLARLNQDDASTPHEQSDQEIDDVADQIYNLLDEVSPRGTTISEILARLKISPRFAKAGLNRLILDRKTVRKRKTNDGVDKELFFTCSPLMTNVDSDRADDGEQTSTEYARSSPDFSDYETDYDG